MKKTILFAVSFLAAEAVWAQQASTQAVNADSVPIEEYVSKVIIEGKWGAGPGEFGSVLGAPLAVSDRVYLPKSLAVDGMQNIYILDTANSRIQKFDGKGKYLLSIPVESLKGEIVGYCVGSGPDGYCTDLEPPKSGMKYDAPVLGKIEVEGINIAIDSKDTLYYYLKRTKDGKETGEVWEFRKDKLARKLTVPVTNSLSSGVGLELYRDDDSLIIPNVDRDNRGRHYDVRAGKVVSTKEMRDRRVKYHATEAGKGAAAKPHPKYYLDIVVSDKGAKVVQKLN